MAHLAGYIRVSKTAGKARLRSPTEQRDEIEVWAKRHGRGHTVDFLEPELDAKGNDPHRPRLRQAVDGVVDGTYAGVVVAYLSRAGRDLRLMLDMWAEVEGVGGTVYFARENIDGSTASGRLQRNILASVAQHELEERREGFDRSLAAAVALGIWPRRQTPLGYFKSPDHGRLVPNDRADDVRWAFGAKAKGTALVDIARRLGMTSTGASELLKNRVYLGELKVGRHFNPAGHEPLVTLEEFEAAQGVNAPRPTRSDQPPALLAGLVRCAACGHLMSRRSGARYTYSCNLVNSGRCKEWASVSLAALDAHVQEIALAELDRLAVTATPGRSAELARVELEAAERELAAYLEAVSAADVGAEAFASGARTRRERVDETRAALRAELARTPAVPVAGKTGAEVWESLDGQERNTLLRGLLAAVVVRRAGGRGARVPLADRVRVLPYGTELALPAHRGNEPSDIVPIPFPNLDSVGVLGVPVVEDAA